uniref:Uncharacterized protein n=1 Tax=Lactuca sativa TaxID=4236 RepID=A0A9R1UFQ6_LACSA|nr:hypothetical protein LSAT_V11C900471940 [Lactuca sativa]
MVMQMVFLLRGLIGRDNNTCILPTMYELADSQYNWNRYLRDNESVGYTRMMKYTVTSFQLPFKENNIPRVFEATPIEIHFPFFVRYVNWTLDKVQSPPQQ